MPGEELSIQQDPRNPVDRYAVAVMKFSMIVGHIPRQREISKRVHSNYKHRIQYN